MIEESTNYSRYFAPSMRVEVRFARSGNQEPFRDGATIIHLEDDLVELKLSRDFLPEGIRADVGTVIDVRTGRDGKAFCCRAIIVKDPDGAVITARFIGKLIPDEMRDFYRIDTYVPIRYHLEPDSTPEQIRERWRATRYPEGEPTTDVPRDTVPSTALDASAVTPLAANLSGSGIRIRTQENLAKGTLVSMELYLDLGKTRVIPVVAEVVDSTPLRMSENHTPIYTTALRFLWIDERDRDEVIRFISMKQLEQLRTRPVGGVSIDSPPLPPRFGRKGVRIGITAAIIVIIIVFLAATLVFLRIHSPKGEIESTFENEIRKYRKLFPWP